MRILVLSGGGANGAFQVGVLKRLWQEDPTLSYDAIFGVSTGALTGGVLAQGGSAEEQFDQLGRVEDVYLSLKGNGGIYSSPKLGILGKALALFSKGGLFNPDPLFKLIVENINPDRLKASPTTFRCGVVSLASGEYMAMDGKDPGIRQSILESASQPVLFQLDSPYCDGGLRNMTPLGDVFSWLKEETRFPETGAKEVSIDVILCGPTTAMDYKNIDHKDAVGVLMRTFEIIMNEAFLSDVRRTLKKNRKPDIDDYTANVRLFAPDRQLGPSLTFDPKRIRETIDEGHETAGNILRMAELY